MANRRWINQGQPQTLVIAVFLLYFNAAFGLLAGLGQGLAGFQGPETLAVVMGGIAGYQIANERRVGYVLGLVVAASPFLLRIFYLGSPFRGADPIRLIFDVALVALLVHNQSREYQNTHFR